MLRIRKRFGRQPFVFIDDSIKNLQELDRHFNRDEKVLSLALAAWGYIGSGDTEAAPQSGYPIFQQTDVVQFLNSSI
jgi:hypothetical protein